MNKRRFGNTNAMITEIGLGTWQLGSKWGNPFDEAEARKILETAYEAGINFFDTADVYNGNMSEKAIGEFIKDKKDEIFITTKCGRALNPHVAEGYTRQSITGFVEGSLKRLGVEKLDMILLHCPPEEVFRKDEVWDALKVLKRDGKLANYGVSIEKVTDGITAMDYGISAIEVIFNMFRLKPSEELFEKAKVNDIGIIARVPLASGMLTGKYTKDTTFGAKDHRTTNRNGEHFDKGETFSGVDYELGLKAVEELKKLFNTQDLIPIALRWILMFDSVSTVIPGSSNANQVISNIRAGEMNPLTKEQMDGVRLIYNEYIKESVHELW